MDLQELKGIIADFVQVGFMEAVKSYEPSKDLLRKNEVKGWLKMMLISDMQVNYLEENGYIKAVRMGTGRNSPFCYSKKEIKQALSMAKINSILIKEQLSNI